MESKLKNKQAELESEKEHQKKSSSGDLTVRFVLTEQLFGCQTFSAAHSFREL